MKANPNLTIGIIAAKKKQMDIFGDWLTTAGIAYELVKKDSTFSMAEPGVKVVTAYGAKGLEFNCVIIPMFAEGYFPFSYKTDDDEAMEDFIVKMRNLAYVSMTRAKNLLTISYWGNKGSRFLSELDPSLYTIVGTNPPKYKPPTTDPIEENKPPKHPGPIPPKPPKPPKPEPPQPRTLAEFLRARGLEVIDKRPSGGALWVVGSKQIEPIIKEAKNKFGADWFYLSVGGRAVNHRSSWYTKSKK